ncbi:MAG: SRPBCC family protein [Acidimicrobiales bacterium]
MPSLHNTCPMVNKHSTHEYQVVIDAPLDAVWNVLALRFDDVGDWSTGVPGSRVADVLGAEGAPVPGRVCESFWRGFDDVTETIVEYGEDPYFFKYIATGTPAWMGVASNTWHVDCPACAPCLVRTADYGVLLGEPSLIALYLLISLVAGGS